MQASKETAFIQLQQDIVVEKERILELKELNADLETKQRGNVTAFIICVGVTLYLGGPMGIPMALVVLNFLDKII